MLKYFIFFTCCLSFLWVPNTIFAQKFGYTDSDYVLSQMPDYARVDDEISKAAENWQSLIEEKWQKVYEMKQKYLNEEILLTEDMKAERLAEMQGQEQEARNYQSQIFGYKGLFFQKRQELIKPIQDEIYKAIEKVCRKNKLQFMFDKSGDLIMLYTDPKHDYTEDLMIELKLISEDPKK